MKRLKLVFNELKGSYDIQAFFMEYSFKIEDEVIQKTSPSSSVFFKPPVKPAQADPKEGRVDSKKGPNKLSK